MKLKSLILIPLISIVATHAFAQQFTLSGNISNAPAGACLYMGYVNSNGKQVIDSCLIQNGVFKIEGEIKHPQAVILRVFTGPYAIVDDYAPNAKNIFIDPGSIIAKGDYNQFQSTETTGSSSDIEYQSLRKVLAPLHVRETEIISMINNRNKIKKADSNDPQISGLNKVIDSVRKQYLAEEEYTFRSFVQAHLNTYVGCFILSAKRTSWALPDLQKAYDAFSPQIQQSMYGENIRKYIEAKDGSAPGHMARDFTATDVKDKKINLSDFKGKYIILDFWASWCVPCRASTPHLISLYNKYHDKGLEVIAIADDDASQKAWKDAIKKDKSDLWTNILRGLNKSDPLNNISSQYNITLLPTKILIDNKGLIIARYLGTEEALTLDKKLGEIFN